MINQAIKDGFTAEKCKFQGVQGYTVKQWIDGAAVCTQFIPEEHFDAFFSSIERTPVIIE